MSNLYRGPSIDASYQISHQLALQFQMRRLKCEKLTDDGHQVMAKAHVAEAAWPNEPKLGSEHLWKFLYIDAHFFPIHY
jgi:hypothetical protein